MRLFIPTYRRLDTQKTWNVIHPDLRHLITFVVRPEEADYIAAKYAPSRVEVLPPEKCTGYAAAVQHIIDINDTPFIYLDDDIKSMRRQLRFFGPVTTPWAGETIVSADRQLELFQSLVKRVHDEDTAACSARPTCYPPKATRISVDGLMHTVHTFQMIAIDPVKIKAAGIKWDTERNSPLSDLAFTLAILAAGYDCVYDCHYMVSFEPMMVGAGGINSTENSRLNAIYQEYLELQRMYPEAVITKTPDKGLAKNNWHQVPVRFNRRTLLNAGRHSRGLGPLVYERLQD